MVTFINLLKLFQWYHSITNVDLLQMSEKDKQVIEIHEISAQVMEVLLDFVYTETVNVSVENVQELLPAACLLQLTGELP